MSSDWADMQRVLKRMIVMEWKIAKLKIGGDGQYQELVHSPLAVPTKKRNQIAALGDNTAGEIATHGQKVGVIG